MARVVTTVSATIAVPREALFPWLVPGVFFDELHTVLRDAAGMPGVERTSGTTGPWDVPGSYRTVHTTDGQAAREEVTGARAPDYFSYRVNEFTSPLIRRLVREARGQWWFVADGANTRATWEYAFDATSPFAMPLLLPMVRVLWRRYMQSALENVRERAEREALPATPGDWRFDLVALHGEQGMTSEDREYRGSRFAEVRDALYANPYRGGRSGEAPGPLPRFKSTIRNAWKGALPFGKPDQLKLASIRSLDSHADLRWGPDGKGFRRILSPNGIAVLGRWEITADTSYTGFFKRGAQGLFVGRYSSDGNETKRGERRSLSLAGKIYPTTDPEHPTPLVPANFMAQEDLGGMRTDHINDAELRNAPNVTAYRRGIYVLVMMRAGMHFNPLDKVSDIRQLFEIAELGKPDGEATRTPEHMMLKMCADQPRIAGDELDFRDEIYAHIFPQGEGGPRGTIDFDIFVSDSTKRSGVLGFRRVPVKDWRRVGRLTLDECVASYNADHVIHFHHPSWREDKDDPTTSVRRDGHRVR